MTVASHLLRAQRAKGIVKVQAPFVHCSTKHTDGVAATLITFPKGNIMHVESIQTPN